MVSDRENVINLHMGIPKSNGLRDDVQVMWSGSALDNSGYTSPDDLGPGNNQFVYSQYNTLAKLPTCGPDTIAPGLTVNGCNNPGGFGGLPVCSISSNPYGTAARSFRCPLSAAAQRRSDSWAAPTVTCRTRTTSRITFRSAA